MLRQLIQDIPNNIHVTPCPEVVLNVPIAFQIFLLFLSLMGAYFIIISLIDMVRGAHY